MARLNLNMSDDLQVKVKEYCELNDISLTTFYHMAVSHYLEHLRLQSNLENIFTSFISEKMKQKKGEQASESDQEKANF